MYKVKRNWLIKINVKTGPDKPLSFHYDSGVETTFYY